MPFAGYKNFAACVKANAGKENPEAYCAEIMRRAEKSMADTFNILKTDDDRRLVFGWASVSLGKAGDQIIDSQDDIIDPADLEEAAYEFNLLAFRGTGEQHTGTAKGRLVESFMVTPDKLEAMGLAKDAVKTGWWVGFKIDDDAAWEKVKKGDYRMFSVQGTAVRVGA